MLEVRTGRAARAATAREVPLIALVAAPVAIPVEVFGQTMLMHGLVDSARRLTDLVNQPDPYLSLTEVSTYPYAADTILGLEKQEHGLINKASIVMLAEMEGEAARAATPAASEMRVAKAPHRILVYTKQFAVNADIHLTTGVDMTNFLAVSPGRFVPVTNATVLPIQGGTQLPGFRRPFLLINREQICYVGDAPEPAAASTDPDGDIIGSSTWLRATRTAT